MSDHSDFRILYSRFVPARLNRNAIGVRVATDGWREARRWIKTPVQHRNLRPANSAVPRAAPGRAGPISAAAASATCRWSSPPIAAADSCERNAWAGYGASDWMRRCEPQANCTPWRPTRTAYACSPSPDCSTAATPARCKHSQDRRQTRKHKAAARMRGERSTHHSSP